MNSVSTTNISDHDFDRPSGTGSLYIATQALRAWLRSACPSGTKALRPSKDLALSQRLLVLEPWAESSSPFGTKKDPKRDLSSRHSGQPTNLDKTAGVRGAAGRVFPPHRSDQAFR